MGRRAGAGSGERAAHRVGEGAEDGLSAAGGGLHRHDLRQDLERAAAVCVSLAATRARYLISEQRRGNR